VEIRADSRRVFRLAWNVGEDGLRLGRGASFEPGRPVEVTFGLPDGDRLTLRASVVGEDEDPAHAVDLDFIDPPADARAALRRYVHGRLGLPS
jgi:hypothetical protein